MNLKNYSVITSVCFIPLLIICNGISFAQSADVTRVRVTGEENNYKFSVTIQSPDTGCEQYADWWEIVSEEGKLIYRRILLHSHVNEQPFTRSGGPVKVHGGQKLIIRAHMNNTGYGGMVARGTIDDGFRITQLNKEFASDLARKNPLPEGCRF